MGVDLVTVDRKHKTIILREVGSSLSARWSLFYRNAGAFLVSVFAPLLGVSSSVRFVDICGKCLLLQYIVDGFDDTNIEAVRESLATVLDDSHMSGLPACVVFTKADLDPEGINLATIKSTLGLDQLAQQRGEKLMTIVGSTVNHELAKKLMEWLENI